MDNPPAFVVRVPRGAFAALQQGALVHLRARAQKEKSTASSTGRAGASGEETKTGDSGSAATKTSWCMRIAAGAVGSGPGDGGGLGAGSRDRREIYTCRGSSPGFGGLVRGVTLVLVAAETRKQKPSKGDVEEPKSSKSHLRRAMWGATSPIFVFFLTF